MGMEELQLTNKLALRLGILQHHESTACLQCARRRSTSGCAPLKTTSFRCFHICQQHSRSKG